MIKLELKDMILGFVNNCTLREILQNLPVKTVNLGEPIVKLKDIIDAFGVLFMPSCIYQPDADSVVMTAEDLA